MAPSPMPGCATTPVHEPRRFERAGGLARARSRVARQVCSKAAQAADSPSAVLASRSSRPGKLGVDEGHHVDAVDLQPGVTLKQPRGLNLHTSGLAAATTTSPEPQPMNRDPRRLRFLKVPSRTLSGWISVSERPWHRALTPAIGPRHRPSGLLRRPRSAAPNQPRTTNSPTACTAASWARRSTFSRVTRSVRASSCE